MAELVRTGIVRSDEANRIGEEDSLDMFESNWFIPLKWSVEVLKGAQKEGLIKTPPGKIYLKKNMIWKSNVHNGPDTASPAVQKSCKMQQQGIKKRLQSFCNALMNSQNEITSYIQKANKFEVPDFQL